MNVGFQLTPHASFFRFATNEIYKKTASSPVEIEKKAIKYIAISLISSGGSHDPAVTRVTALESRAVNAQRLELLEIAGQQQKADGRGQGRDDRVLVTCRLMSVGLDFTRVIEDMQLRRMPANWHLCDNILVL